MKKILNIGDVHGRDRWMFYTHGSPYEFMTWKNAVENGSPADNEFWGELPYMNYDKIIFVGDYCDAFDRNNETILEILKNIIFFQKMLPEKVVLLLGNHDIQYMVFNQVCTGYREEMSYDLSELLMENEALFEFAHQETGGDNQIYLWTHAGVTNGWLEQVKKEVFHEKYRFYPITKDYKEANIADFINMLWGIRNDHLFDVDYESGGIQKWASPIWVRRMLDKDPIQGINQIVGHIPQNKIKKVEFDGFTHYYIDCLFDDVEETLILEI